MLLLHADVDVDVDVDVDIPGNGVDKMPRNYLRNKENPTVRQDKVRDVCVCDLSGLDGLASASALEPSF